MVSAKKVPLAIQQAGEQLVRKNKRVGGSVDAAKLLSKLRDTVSYTIIRLAPTLISQMDNKDSILPSTG